MVKTESAIVCLKYSRPTYEKVQASHSLRGKKNLMTKCSAKQEWKTATYQCEKENCNTLDI